MTEFKFETNEESEGFCKTIANEMVQKFGISKREAITRINCSWKNAAFLESTDIRYHEDEEFWANDIYFGPDSNWWLNPSDLKPIPLSEIES